MQMQWHQLGHMHTNCTLSPDRQLHQHLTHFFTCRMIFETPSRQCQSTEGTTDVKKNFFYFGHVFLFSKCFFYFKRVGKVQSGKQINKKHFQNNSNEMDL